MKNRAGWYWLHCVKGCVPMIQVVSGCVGACRCGRLLRVAR